MSLVPAWAPNVHPMLVHFPIALLFTSVLLDLLAYSLPGRARVLLRNVGSVLGVIGAFAALATYLTGRAAAQTVLIPGMAHALVNAHWEWAFWTLWYFGGSRGGAGGNAPYRPGERSAGHGGRGR